MYLLFLLKPLCYYWVEKMPVIQAVETQLNDPLLYMTPLPFEARYYPYGFPVDLASNMREVLDAAQASWGPYAARFDKPPIRMHVLVTEGGAGLPPDPILRGQRNMLIWICDRENFAFCDYLQRFGYSSVTRATLADQVFFRWHFLDAVVSTLLELNYFTSLHAACIALDGAGLLLYGDSGVGKSTLSYACARRGWTYISDDASSVLWDGGRSVIGEPHHFRFRADAPDLFPELRDLTVGRQLDRKPTIEVHTANLPIRTAPECRVERVVFLDRRAGLAVSVRTVGPEEARERILKDIAIFDPALQARRMALIDSMSELPAVALCYSSYDEAVLRLEQIVRGGESA